MIKDRLTREQERILNSDGNITIIAVAGSGKTSTIIEYAATRSANARILYLAFNRSVKLEAAQRFLERGLHNVTVETAHSLAFRHVMPGKGYTIKAQGYKTQEIVTLLELQGNGNKHSEYVIASHINRFITYFCNSREAKVQDLNYLDTVTDENAISFVRSFYKQIALGTRTLLAKMDRKEIDVTHDFYLKKFQLSQPRLPFDHILFDEGQDASAAMLDVFLQQDATKVIVGDTHQQIYGWRYAVNSLQKTNYPTLPLLTSFRFHQDIAALATAVLDWKKMIHPEHETVSITGSGGKNQSRTKATIARSNLGLLIAAINYITDHRKVEKLYFEGNISSYTYANDGASLYDVLNLHNGKRHLIRDEFIKSMHTIDELEEYVTSTEDTQLGMMIEIVKEYGDEIGGILKKLKDLHVGDAEKQQADMIFSTVHRAKGMEYDTVYLADDFLNAEKIDRLLKSNKFNQQAVANSRINEEINLLYVAITRAQRRLYIPASLMPENFPASPHIIVTQTKADNKKVTPKKEQATHRYTVTAPTRPSGQQIKEKAYAANKEKNTSQNAYKPWTTTMDEELKWFYEHDQSIGEIASHFKKTKGAIIARLKHLHYYTEE